MNKELQNFITKTYNYYLDQLQRSKRTKCPASGVYVVTNIRILYEVGTTKPLLNFKHLHKDEPFLVLGENSLHININKVKEFSNIRGFLRRHFFINWSIIPNLKNGHRWSFSGKLIGESQCNNIELYTLSGFEEFVVKVNSRRYNEYKAKEKEVKKLLTVRAKVGALSTYIEECKNLHFTRDSYHSPLVQDLHHVSEEDINSFRPIVHTVLHRAWRDISVKELTIETLIKYYPITLRSLRRKALFEAGIYKYTVKS